MASSSYGVVGLGVMGSSLSLNLAEKSGQAVSGFDLSVEKGAATEARAASEGLGSQFKSYGEMHEFVASLERPRRIILLVPAGPAVDACLAQLGDLLQAGDVVMDGGNEWYENTERREKAMALKGLHYMGCGVSGGAEGARHGPALMVGGPEDAWKLMAEALKAIAARAPDGSECVVYCGAGGAGNYVKMVHNGIEYGDMQLIGEAYALLRASGKSNKAIARVFAGWNKDGHPLQSFLVEITSKILTVPGDSGDLIDVVLDQAGSKGTGKWTVQDAAELGLPAPTVSAALEARYVSALKSLRVDAAPMLEGPTPSEWPDDLESVLEAAMVCSKICSYAQGLALIAKAASERGWNTQIPDVLACWRGGCIIRASLLADFKRAIAAHPTFDNLLATPPVSKLVAQRQLAWRKLVAAAVLNGVPVPAMANSLAYYDQLRSPRLLAAALIQAQRDCFGGHTYKRNDHPPDDRQPVTTDWLGLAVE